MVALRKKLGYSSDDFYKKYHYKDSMPGYRAHLTVAGLFGIATLITLHYHTPLSEIITLKHLSYILISMIGGLFPDIDIASKGQRLLYLFLLPTVLIGIIKKDFYVLAVAAITAVMPPLFGHRGITHTLWFTLMCPLFIPLVIKYYYPSLAPHGFSYYLFFVAGATSHILIDFMPKKLIRKVARLFSFFF